MKGGEEMKKLLTAVICLTLLLAFTGSVLADDDSLLDKIKDQDIVKEADKVSANIVSTVRQLALILAVVFGVLLAISLWSSGGDGRALAEMKGRLLVFVLSLFVLLRTEVVVGWIAGLFGYK
jgi:hypothetical protein